MAILPILQYPDPRLNRVAKPVEHFDEQLAQFSRDLLETLAETGAVGIAATQVNHEQRVIACDTHDNPFILCNPEILSREGTIDSQEACLSFPGVFVTVKRAKTIQVRYYDLSGTPQEIQASDLLSRCLQHEIDHLNGITFDQHLSPLKKSLFQKKLAKYRKRIL